MYIHFLGICQLKNFENQSTFAKAMTKRQVSCFLWGHSVLADSYTKHATQQCVAVLASGVQTTYYS